MARVRFGLVTFRHVRSIALVVKVHKLIAVAISTYVVVSELCMTVLDKWTTISAETETLARGPTRGWWLLVAVRDKTPPPATTVWRLLMRAI